MGKVISRQQLYDLAWSEPIVRLAKDFGVSDVALAKACRKLAVPLPPRGYWARKAAGKPAIQTPLPLRPPGLEEVAVVGGGWQHPRDIPIPEDELLGPAPEPPVFTEPMEEVAARVDAMIGKGAVIQKNLEAPHPVVAALLKKDSDLRRKRDASPYPSIFDAPLYDTPLEQRRLRLLSAILLTTARCGCRADSWGAPEYQKPRSEFAVKVGSTSVELRVGVPEPPKTRRGLPPAGGSGTKTPKLRVEVNPGDFHKVGALSWEDVEPGDGRVIREIAAAIVVKGEEILRAGAVAGHEWRLSHRADLLVQRRKAAAEAERERLARIAELERQRVERLLGEAEALRKAHAIRGYVTEVRQANAAAASPVTEADLDAWAAWALAQADRIDPVASGAFLKLLE